VPSNMTEHVIIFNELEIRRFVILSLNKTKVFIQISRYVDL
jgi:hypothetical protein